MFAATIDFIDDESDGGDRRAGADRVAIDRPSTLRAPERVPLDIAIEDLSARGFRFVVGQKLRVGMIVRVGLCGAGVQDARIVRCDGMTYGCAFLEPLSTARMATAFTAAAVVQGPFAATGPAAAQVATSDRWPGAVRLAVLIGASALLWAVLWTGVRSLLG